MLCNFGQNELSKIVGVAPYINIHTHRTTSSKTAVCIENLDIFDTIITPHSYYSIGLHPWDIEKFEGDIIQVLAGNIDAEKNILAIGEIGLDKAIQTPLSIQLAVFEKQLLFANAHQMPVIIHCVRAFNEIIALKLNHNISVPLILHGYNGNAQTTKQLFANGFYFSFGTLLTAEKSKAHESLTLVPITKLFLETDNSDCSIELLYKIVSQRHSMQIEILKHQFFENFKNVFGGRV